MLENVYDTIFAILQLNLPKDINGNCVVYDKPILGWYIGDPTPQANQPNISIQGSTSKPKNVGQGSWEYEHTLTVKLAIAQDTPELSERNAQEFAREIRNALLPHRRIWVCLQCPFDRLSILTPLHYTQAHSTILAPYMTEAQTNFTNTWNETHDPTTNPAPLSSLPNSGIAMASLSGLLSDISNHITVANMPASVSTGQVNSDGSSITWSPLSDIQYFIANNQQFVRLLYNVSFSDIKPSGGEQNEALRKTGEFTITANEVVKQPSYGPDNIPSSGYQRFIIP